MISMKEYKVLDALNEAEAERTMNKMASEGWRVICVTYNNTFQYLIITFERIV